MVLTSRKRSRQYAALTGLLGLLATASMPASAFQTAIPERRIVPSQFHRLASQSAFRLFSKPETNKFKTKGVYVRPSGAIERGSGFFVPGLEGPRVRLLFGVVLLALTALNHVVVQLAADFSLEEQISIFYSILILFQAAIEFRKEDLIVESGGGSSGGSGGSNGNSSSNGTSLSQRNMLQKWNQAEQLTQSEKDKIQWAANAFLSVTPATQMFLVSKDAIVYRLGCDENTRTAATDNEKIEQGVRAALEQLSRSKGGRVALPDSHPAVVALGLQTARTVVLQRISEDSCWVMSSSDQLLVSFAPADLKWLGQLARYVSV